MMSSLSQKIRALRFQLNTGALWGIVLSGLFKNSIEFPNYLLLQRKPEWQHQQANTCYDYFPHYSFMIVL